VTDKLAVHTQAAWRVIVAELDAEIRRLLAELDQARGQACMKAHQ
jgi:hypothetical protein